MRSAPIAFSILILILESASGAQAKGRSARTPPPSEADGRLTQAVLRSLPTPPAKPPPLKVRLFKSGVAPSVRLGTETA